MERSIRVNAYKKESSLITGRMELFGFYEVMSSSIEKYKLREEPLVFPAGNIVTLDLVKEVTELYEWGLDENDILWYRILSNTETKRYTRTVNGETAVLMFEPGNISNSLDRLIKATQDFINPYRGTDKEMLFTKEVQKQERKFLLDFESVIVQAYEADGMVGCTIS